MLVSPYDACISVWVLVPLYVCLYLCVCACISVYECLYLRVGACTYVCVGCLYLRVGACICVWVPVSHCGCRMVECHLM